MLPPEPGQEPQDPSLSIFAVIVLYKIRPAESPSYRTLLSAFARVPKDGIRLEVLLYDNTPGGGGPDELPEFVTYFSSSINTGLATAYNFAADLAAKQNFLWLLTLDQDTTLPDTFFEQLAPIIGEQQADPRVAAIVPHISSGTRTLSPYSLRGHVKPRWFPEGFCGVPAEAVYAINSGALIRIAALQQIGGYSQLFWLDASDMYLFRRLERTGKKVFVAGTISVQHDLSLGDVENKMSLSRFANALAAGSAFYDIEFGRLAGFGHNLLLFHLYLKQLRSKQKVEVRRLTLSLIRTRLLQSRTRRLQSWLASEDDRITLWQNQRELSPGHHDRRSQQNQISNSTARSLQTVSILAVVVLYRTSPTDSLTVITLNAAAAPVSTESLRFKRVLYDNTPDSHGTPALEPGTVYIASGRNRGLSEAYNHAVAIADLERFDWILTLDQDTELPVDFLANVVDIIRQIGDQRCVAAILPLVKQGERVLSPHYFKFDFFPRAFSSSSNGVPSRSVYAFNSGAILRTRALQNVGGYNPLFWLDYSDAYLFRRLHLLGYKAFVAGGIVIQHHLSVLNTEEVSEDRYRNIVQAGSAFCDLYRNSLVRLEFTYKLIRSYIGQTLKAHGEIKRQILREAITDRLFKSRHKRIQEWIRRETDRSEAAPPI